MYRRAHFDGANRIAWSSADAERLGRHFGAAAVRDMLAAPAAPALPDLPVTVTRDGKAGKTYTFTISTPSVDAMGDTVSVSGWDLKRFRSNPVVLFQHNQNALPIGKAVDTWISGSRLMSTVKLADRLPLADRVRQLIDGGVLKASSVGFVPLKFAFSKDPARPYGIDFIEQSLLEWSVVNVPANPDALLAGSTSEKSLAGGDARARRLREIEALKLGATL